MRFQFDYIRFFEKVGNVLITLAVIGFMIFAFKSCQDFLIKKQCVDRGRPMEYCQKYMNNRMIEIKFKINDE